MWIWLSISGAKFVFSTVAHKIAKDLTPEEIQLPSHQLDQ